MRGEAGGARAEYSNRPKGYTTLYHATASARLKQVFLDDEKIYLSNTMPGPDYANDLGWDSYGVLFYWTPQMWVADLYARYCQKALGMPWDVCLMKMVARPGDISLEGGLTWKLEYGDDWRKLIWHSKNRKEYSPTSPPSTTRPRSPSVQFRKMDPTSSTAWRPGRMLRTRTSTS